ncbi:MAG: EAL domain-containing protein [bacterium]
MENQQNCDRVIETLLRTSKILLNAKDFKEAAEIVFQNCREIIRATGGYIALHNKLKNENEVVFINSGGSVCNVDSNLPMPIRGLRGEVTKTGRAKYYNDFQSTEWASLLPEGHILLDNVLMAPFLIEGKVVGLFGLSNKPGGFTEDDVNIVSLFAEYAASSLYNIRAGELLKKSEECFRSVTASATDVIICADAQGNITLWNKSAENIFGYSSDELIGKPLDIIIPEQFRKAHQKALSRFISTGQSKLIGRTIETTGLRKNNSVFPLELSLSAWKIKEETFFTAIIRDISKRKLDEEKIHQLNNALEQRVNERTAELKKAYDIQTTINSILQFSLKDVSLEEILKYTLNLILSINWLSFESRGSIFLVENDPDILVMKAQNGLSEYIQTTCSKVPFGKCLCGKAAVEKSIEFSDKLSERHEVTYENIESHGHYCVPILHLNKILGVVNIYIKEGHKHSNIEEEFLTAVANTLANIVILRQSEKEMRKLLLAVEQTTDWVIITNKTGDIEYINKAVEDISGYKKEELIGQNTRIFKSDKHNREFYKEIWDSILSGKSWVGIIINRKKDGRLFEVYNNIMPLKDDKGVITHFVSIAKDITQQKLIEKRLNYLAYYDTITDLPNRNLFIDRITQSITRAEYNKKFIALLSIDIDRFKFINDSFGVETGNMVLKEVGKILSGSLYERDTVARLGNDEFGVLLIDIISSEDIILLIEKIMKNFETPLKINNEEIALTISIGISICPDDGKDVNELMKKADLALLKAKEQGRKNYQFYTPEIDTKALEFTLLEKHLLNALKNNEFVLYYQPYFDIITKKIAGMEALIRWNNKELGLICPGKFIPVLEETKMIIEVGEWVLKTAVKQVKEWQDKGLLIVPVSVNLSLIQFKQKDLSKMVNSIIDEAGLSPSFLTLEITESVFTEDIEYTKSVLKELKNIGISISIDDFGTGYSSLTYLKRFPIDNLKIDISFIREITLDPDTASIVTAIIAMAHTLNIKTIAEGVETEEQWKILRLLRCNIAQGYYFSKPITAEDMEKML